MKKIIIFAVFAVATAIFVGCKKYEVIEPATKVKTVIDTVYQTVYIYGGNGINPTPTPTPTPGWNHVSTPATISGNEFCWNISNSVIDPAGKEIFVAWVATGGQLCYNKLAEGVVGVFSAGTVSSDGTIKFQLNPAYGKLKFNLAVNVGGNCNQWYWFTAQGNYVQLPCQHTSQGWCYDDGVNNIFSSVYSGGTWIPGAPC